MATSYSRRRIQASGNYRIRGELGIGVSLAGCYGGSTFSVLVSPPECLLMDCRPDCGACCIAPSISSPLPGMPNGKPANTRCLHLAPDMRCELFHSPLRPAVCSGLQARADMCFSNREAALIYLVKLEVDTAP